MNEDLARGDFPINQSKSCTETGRAARGCLKTPNQTPPLSMKPKPALVETFRSLRVNKSPATEPTACVWSTGTPEQETFIEDGAKTSISIESQSDRPGVSKKAALAMAITEGCGDVSCVTFDFP
ncbi:hypothetical protein FJTKL_02132 [Diaporthe vaccinii]|uniref:Uncharacterized protein n=1 Tax=Diaporthe vaccinii TaxID=105482 RepID=A0ABR4DYT3_9PEZI